MSTQIGWMTDPYGMGFKARPATVAAAPRRRNARHEDSCSLACEADREGGVNCWTYVGRHRAEVS